LNDWIPLFWTIGSLAALWIVARWISAHIQALGWLIAGHADGAVVALWVILFPGILVHELSHWLVAKMLGLKVKLPNLYPKRHGKHIRLGSVTVASGGHLLDSFVGMAPFLLGSLSVLVLGASVFDVTGLVRGVTQAGLAGALQGLLGVLKVSDAWLWLYLTFAISNAMFPSPSDTEPVRPVLMFSGLLICLALIVGWTPQLGPDLVAAINRILLVLAEAFTFVLVVDVGCGALIILLEFVLGALRGQRVVFESSGDSSRRKGR
jgi:hypothetical protein